LLHLMGNLSEFFFFWTNTRTEATNLSSANNNWRQTDQLEILLRKKKGGDILDDGWDQFANLSTLSLGWSKITEKKKIKISSCTFIHLQLTPWCKKITENSQW